MEKYFFDLPVYRVSKDEYYQWFESQKQPARKTWQAVGNDMPRNTAVALETHLYERYGPWNFNEIIGYIRLHFLGSQVRGKYFSAEKKRNPVSRKKVFTYRTHKLAPEHNFFRDKRETNQAIWDGICQYVADCQRELTKGRVIDDSKLQALGPHVDWLAFLGWSVRSK